MDTETRLNKMKNFYLLTIGKCNNFIIYDMKLSKYILYDCSQTNSVPKFVKILNDVNPMDYYYDVLSETMTKREYFTIKKFREYLNTEGKYNLNNAGLLVLPSKCKGIINGNTGINVYDLNSMYGLILQHSSTEQHTIKYITCINGIPNLMTCPEESAFDGINCV